MKDICEFSWFERKKERFLRRRDDSEMSLKDESELACFYFLSITKRISLKLIEKNKGKGKRIRSESHEEGELNPD